MRRWLPIVLLFLSAAAYSAQFVSATNIECRDGKAMLARHWEVAFAEEFEKGLEAWQTENYEGNLKLEVAPGQPHGGAASLRVSWVKSTDTAWEIKSRPIPVCGGGPFEFRYWFRSSRSITGTTPHQGHYESRMEWQDAAGKLLGFASLTYGDASDHWREIVIAGTVPEGTKQAVIRFGFDGPNITGDDFLALDDLRLLQRTEQSGYEMQGEFLSRPFPAAQWPQERKVQWQAETPPGTSLTVELRSAPDDNGGPGRWGDFVSVATGTTLDPKGAWVQYRAKLITRDRQRTPALTSVILAGVRDDGFTGVDTEGPQVMEFTPVRTADASAPLRFYLNDGGVGYDGRTLQVSLDGRPVRGSLGRAGYMYQPPQPLAPPSPIGSFSAWRTRNHANALTIAPDAPRTSEGAPSLLVTRSAKESDTAFALVSPPIPVAAGEKYTLSFWLRTDAAVEVADGRGGGLTWLDANAKPLGDPVRISYGPKNAEWHEVRQDVTAPAGAEWAVVGFGWDTPNFANGQFAQFAEPDLIGLHPPRPSATPNLHEVKISVADYAGNATGETRYILVKEPPTSGIVTIRKDGVTLVDGKPFFPIGIYSVSKLPVNDNNYDKAFAELKAAGFNLAHTYNASRNADFAEFMDAARRHGLKVFISPESGNNNPSVASALATVARECNDPAILAWYLADDTSGHIGAGELRRVHEGIMQIDPFHMTTQADGITRPDDQRYTSYVESTTGFLPEIYPIYLKTGNHVADVIRGMKNVQAAWAKAGRVTPVWAIIQDFEGWGWQRYPTNEEERCMVYLALIHGAQGMTWYTYSYRPPDKHGAAYDPKVWAYLKGIAGELSSLTGPLTAPPAKDYAVGEIIAGPQSGDLDYPSLNLRLMQSDGHWTLLAANSAEKPITARIALPGAPQEAEVLFEGRKLPVKAGKLEDTFAALAVHVYRW